MTKKPLKLIAVKYKNLAQCLTAIKCCNSKKALRVFANRFGKQTKSGALVLNESSWTVVTMSIKNRVNELKKTT